MVTYAEQIRERLAALVEPLRDEERKVTERIAELEAELHELRPIRVELRRQIRGITGEPAVNQNGKPHGNAKRKGKTPGPGTATGSGISEERMQEVLTWLEEHAADYPEGFHGSGLVRVESFPLSRSGQSTAARALRILQERGALVLDHLGGSGGAKFYKLAPAPGRKASL